MALTRENIVQAAIKLLRQDGLDALSLRKLAAELNVSAPTLYWHVASKRELLDLVADELVRGQQAAQRERPAPDQPWWEWLYEWADRYFDALITTRDAPRVMAGNRPSIESLPRVERTLTILVEAGLPAADAQRALFAIGAYTIGAATEWQSEMARAVEGAETDGRLAAAIRSGEFPRLIEALAGMAQQPPRATFEYGLRLLIDALRARYAPESLAGPSA
jgi:TetR/AcrR family transcriptional regulator, tetracycline repressor protein